MVQLHESANFSILFCKFMSTSASFILKFSGVFFLKQNHSLKITVFFSVGMKCDENSNFPTISYETLNTASAFNIM